MKKTDKEVRQKAEELLRTYKTRHTNLVKEHAHLYYNYSDNQNNKAFLKIMKLNLKMELLINILF